MAAPNTTSTTPAIKSPANPSFRFMDLPAGLRIKVYKIAVRDYIEAILRPKAKAIKQSSPARPELRYRGALALLQTSKTQRIESAHAMLALATAEYHRRRKDDALTTNTYASYDADPDDGYPLLCLNRAFMAKRAMHVLKYMLEWGLSLDSADHLCCKHGYGYYVCSSYDCVGADE